MGGFSVFGVTQHRGGVGVGPGGRGARVGPGGQLVEGGLQAGLEVHVLHRHEAGLPEALPQLPRDGLPARAAAGRRDKPPRAKSTAKNH